MVWTAAAVIGQACLLNAASLGICWIMQVGKRVSEALCGLLSRVPSSFFRVCIWVSVPNHRGDSSGLFFLSVDHRPGTVAGPCFSPVQILCWKKIWKKLLKKFLPIFCSVKGFVNQQLLSLHRPVVKSKSLWRSSSKFTCVRQGFCIPKAELPQVNFLVAKLFSTVPIVFKAAFCLLTLCLKFSRLGLGILRMLSSSQGIVCYGKMWRCYTRSSFKLYPV